METQSTYGYNTTTGRLASVSDGAQTFQYSYLANSSLIETVTGPAHTVTNTYATDRDVLLSKDNKVGSTTVSKYTYTVNAIGQRSAVAQTGSAFPTSNGWNWGYDALGQVTSAEHATTPANHRAYQYDTIGNRNKSINGNLDPNDPSATTYATNNLNQYTSVGTVSPIHDADGNMTSGQLPAGSAGLVWDAEQCDRIGSILDGGAAEARRVSHATPRMTNQNRLTTVSISGGDTVHYLYDAQSRRIARTVGTDITLFVYDAWNVIAEYTSSGSPFTLSKSYLWGTDLSGSMQGAGGVGGLLLITDHSALITFFPTYDGNGNVSDYLDATGTIAAHFEYDPFGNTIVNTDTTNQFPYRFSTKPIDETTGLYYYGYRYYNPTIGRWPSRDPIGENGGLNLYGFVGNNGSGYSDYLGLAKITWGEKVTSNDLKPGGTLTPYPGGPSIPVDGNSGGVTVLEFSVTAECVCVDERAMKKKYILKEYSIVIKAHVYLLQKDAYESNEHYQFAVKCEDDHVGDFKKWAESEAVKSIVNNYEKIRKNNSQNNKFDTKKICEEKNIEKFNQAAPLAQSARDAVAKTIRNWDHGNPPPHQWKSKK